MKQQTQKNLPIAKTNIKPQNPNLVTFYDIWPRNWVGLFL